MQIMASRTGSGTSEEADVLTLSEAATYLRVAEEEVVTLVESRTLPGRRIGAEWRFLKAAIQEWLSMPPARTGTEAQLAAVGSWKDDPHVADELRETYARRGRPEDGVLP